MGLVQVALVLARVVRELTLELRENWARRIDIKQDFRGAFPGPDRIAQVLRLDLEERVDLAKAGEKALALNRELAKARDEVAEQLEVANPNNPQEVSLVFAQLAGAERSAAELRDVRTALEAQVAELKRKLEVPDVAATAELAASRNELKVLRDELQRAKEDHADACRSYESKLEGVNVELRKSAAQLRATCEQTDRLLEQVRMLNATPDLRKAVDVHLSALVEWDVDRKNYEGAIDQMRENLKRSASDLRELRERMEARLSQKCKELERLKLSIGSVLDGEDVED